MKNKKIAWTAAFSWMAIIFILSHQPATVSGGLSTGITEFLLDIYNNLFPGINVKTEEFHIFVRKNAHFIAYLVLGVLLVNALGRWGELRRRNLLTSFLIALLYAASDEFHQLFIDGRSGELRDVLIDGAGAATGIVICWLINVSIQNRKR